MLGQLRSAYFGKIPVMHALCQCARKPKSLEQNNHIGTVGGGAAFIYCIPNILPQKPAIGLQFFGSHFHFLSGAGEIQLRRLRSFWTCLVCDLSGRCLQNPNIRWILA